MSIDRIGKREGPSGIGPPENQPLSRTTERVGESFQISAPVAPQASGSLDRLRAGETTLSQYLDDKVEAATQHLAGRLSPEDLEWLQQRMREQLATDPVLVDLVKAASGSVPSPKE